MREKIKTVQATSLLIDFDDVSAMDSPTEAAAATDTSMIGRSVNNVGKYFL